MKSYDLIVLGAGRASNLASKAGSLGKKVAIVEKQTLGGTCANRGCVPSKLLIGYANKIRNIQKAKDFFIDNKLLGIDAKKIFEAVNEHIKAVEPKYKKKFHFDEYPDNVDIYKGQAKFVSNYIIEVNGEKITSKTIVIATGTRAVKAPYENAWTSEDIFPFTHKIPNSIVIVGAGFIACELGNFFDAIGVKTTQLVRGDKLLKNEDEDISEIFTNEYSKNIDVKFQTSIKNATYKNGEFELTLQTNNEQTTLKTDALLYATGRISNADTLDLQNTDIKVNEKNFILNDEFFQTNVKGIYVVGDAHGKYLLQHAAAYEVNYLVKILYENETKPLKFKYMPHGVFSNPEIASVGLSEQEAKAKGVEYVSNITDWSASAKALALKENYPKTKILVNPNTYEILGFHLIGFESSAILHQVLAVMHINNDVRHLKDMLYIHPALNEALLPAVVDIVQKVQEYKKR